MLRRLVLLLPSLLLGTATVQAEIIERVIAQVNGEIITQTEFQSRQLAAAQAGRVTPDKVGQFLRENNARILQEAIDDILLVQRAEDAGLHLPASYINDVIDGIKKENHIENDAQFQEQLQHEGMTFEGLPPGADAQAPKRSPKRSRRPRKGK